VDKNGGRLPFNPINHKYDPTEAGRRLKYQDDDARVRRLARSDRLDHLNSNLYNPINGQRRNQVEELVPLELLHRYYNKKRAA
jgi:hypothetical protein